MNKSVQKTFKPFWVRLDKKSNRGNENCNCNIIQYMNRTTTMKKKKVIEFISYWSRQKKGTPLCHWNWMNGMQSTALPASKQSIGFESILYSLFLFWNYIHKSIVVHFHFISLFFCKVYFVDFWSTSLFLSLFFLFLNVFSYVIIAFLSCKIEIE